MEQEEKKLPDRLEEAAEEYNKQVIEETKCHHNALTYAEGYEDALLLIPDAFIAGAEWMKEHMMNIKTRRQTKATIKSTGKVVEVTSRFMPKKKTEPSRDWVCNLSDGTCIDEKELDYAPDTSATIGSILNEFGRELAGKCYGASPVSDSCGIVVNKVNTEEYINRIVDAVKEQMLEWAKEKYEEYDRRIAGFPDDGAYWGQRNAFRQMIDKLNSI